MALNAARLGARQAALEALGQVLRRRRPLDAALAECVDGRALDARDRGFARAIAIETMRRFGRLDALVRNFVPDPPAPHRAGPTPEILLIGACELLFLGVAPHAAVDGANRLAAEDTKARHFKPLINAVLRRVAREGRAALDTQDGARLAVPDWLWVRWSANFGEALARKIVTAHGAIPPLDLMPKIPDAALARELGAEALPGGTLRLLSSSAVEALPGYADGAWWVQDIAASLPARLLGDVRGARVLDLCAAPGGKTAQLAAAGGDVVAVDRDTERLGRLTANLARLDLHARTVAADVRDLDEAPAPFVLLDAPCTATGTIRRHPELPWIKGAADVDEVAGVQHELLDAAARLVAPGGILVYAVCSLEPEEGPDQVARFLSRHGEFARLPLGIGEVFGLAELVNEAGDLRTLPCHLEERGGMDGFYAARLRRISA